MAALAASVLSAAACSGAREANPIAPSVNAISAAQAAALADKRVSFDEYQAGYRRYQSCMQTAGFSVTTLGLQYNVYEYRLTEAAEKSQANNHCYPYEFAQLDEEWQVENQDNSQTSAHLAGCLQHANLPVGVTVAEDLATLQKHGLDPTTCQTS